jgi:molecular chaperone HtpG
MGVKMSDNWRAETQLLLCRSGLYSALKNKISDETSSSHIIALVDDAAYYASERLKLVLKNMGEYTLHDTNHIFQVLEIMELLIGKENLNYLNIPELMLLIMSALLHDIGMAPAESEIIAWKKIWDTSPELSDEEKVKYNEFKRFLSAYPEKTKQIQTYISEGNLTNADLLKGYLVSTYIRETHSKRARDIIRSDWNEKIKYKDTDLTIEFVEICYSHSVDALNILSMDMQFLCGHGEYVCLPLIAVVLRLSDILDFDSKRTPEVLLSNLTVRNPVSLIEWKKHRSIESWIINKNIIQFHAKCRHPAIESAIHKFCDQIDKELIVCNNILIEINKSFSYRSSQILITLPYKVDRSKIETKKNIEGNPEYIFKETRFSLSKNQVIDLLMGTKLYGNPGVSLRELLQNSIDACLLRQSMEKDWGNKYEPEISVIYDNTNKEPTLVVIDNGIGMDQYIIDKYYTNIGNSFYKSADFYDLKAKTNADFTPTSRFGIGILSCFMIADTMIVDTRKVYGPHDSGEPLNLTVEGYDSIFWIKKGMRLIPGTTTKLILRKNTNPWDNLTDEKFISAVESIIPNPPFKIVIKTNTKTFHKDENSFNTFDINILKKQKWEDHEHIREISFKINEPNNGIIASIAVALLETKGRPIDRINLKSKQIKIDNEYYELERTITSNSNEIKENSTTITIDDDGEIDTSTTYSTLVESASMISLHGIEIPTSLFPSYFEKKYSPVFIDWPFPALLIVDICGQRDIDLNSARNQILLTNNWIDFEEIITSRVLENIKKDVGGSYWDNLYKIISKSNNATFIRVLNSLK